MAKNRNRSRRTSRRSPNKPMMIKMPLPGFEGAMDDDCSCPICAAAAARGEPMHTLDENGELVEVRNKPRPMMQVRVRGNATTWPYLSAEAETLDVPRGCIVQDLLAYLTFGNREFQIAFPAGTLSARIRGEACEARRVLMANDELVVSGHPDPEQSRLMAQMLRPWS